MFPSAQTEVTECVISITFLDEKIEQIVLRSTLLFAGILHMTVSRLSFKIEPSLVQFTGWKKDQVFFYL